MTKFHDLKSIIIISLYSLVNVIIVFIGIATKPVKTELNKSLRTNAPEYTEISKLEYFHLRDSQPQMSLSANHMKSQGEDFADFEFPSGIYNYQKKDKLIYYKAESGAYQKNRELLTLTKNVVISSEASKYQADQVKYFFKKDLILGKGNIYFQGEDPKTKDDLYIQSDTMKARPDLQITKFKGHVKGSLERKKKYERKMFFASDEFDFDGNKSLANLSGDVKLKRGDYDISAGKGDIYLENYNKKLKYFVLNDDVKVIEKIQTKQGVQQREAFAERLEGFGREQRMVLTGAPRVEMGKDIIKGYRITIRENVDLIEVDDAMSDVQVKQKKKLKEEFNER
jgi:lipopolysaccharide transport protein LptA